MNNKEIKYLYNYLLNNNNAFEKFLETNKNKSYQTLAIECGFDIEKLETTCSGS